MTARRQCREKSQAGLKNGGLSSRFHSAKSKQAPLRLAVLVSPTAIVSPSSYSSLAHFTGLAQSKGLDATLISPHALGKLPDFDALFIRMTTELEGDAHKFALRAKKLGLPVIDDPSSIVNGSNKVVQHGLLSTRQVAMPRTIILSSPEQARTCAKSLGLPVVFKIADGCFCRGVEKAETIEQCEEVVTQLLSLSGVILAQEFVPTRFDWRIGVLGGSTIFACKYHMVADHWQVVARGSRGNMINGPVEAVPLRLVPEAVSRLARKAAACIGDGFYGVDIKQTPAGPIVIEVNDNPDMDIDAETVANPEAWDCLAEWFVSSIAARHAEMEADLRVRAAG